MKNSNRYSFPLLLKSIRRVLSGLKRNTIREHYPSRNVLSTYLKFHYYTCPVNENYSHPSVWIGNRKGGRVSSNATSSRVWTFLHPLRAWIKISDLSSWKNYFQHAFIYECVFPPSRRNSRVLSPFISILSSTSFSLNRCAVLFIGSSENYEDQNLAKSVSV